MSVEQELLEKWRVLSADKQQQVMEFVEFLHLKTVNPSVLTRTPKNNLGERLRQIRTQIVASDEPLLNHQEIEKEMAGRRGGLLPSDE